MRPPPLPPGAAPGFSSFFFGICAYPGKTPFHFQDIVIAMTTGIGTGRGGTWIAALGAGIAMTTAAGIMTEVGIPKGFQGQREWEQVPPHGQRVTGNPTNSHPLVIGNVGCVRPSHSQTDLSPSPGYDSRIGSGRRAFGSGYRRDDDYRGYEDRYDRRDDRMDRWNSRDDYGRDDFRREDRGGLGPELFLWERLDRMGMISWERWDGVRRIS